MRGAPIAIPSIQDGGGIDAVERGVEGLSGGEEEVGSADATGKWANVSLRQMVLYGSTYVFSKW